jgi:hypothetical protein
LAEAGKPLPVPANSFSEYAPEPNPETKKKDVFWFALNEAAVIVGARAEHYYSNPRIRFIEIGVPPAGTALVRR